jgi:hypothetical protein
VEISEIVYFDEPGISNTERMLQQCRKRLEALKIEYVVIASNTGFTVRKSIQAFDDLRIQMIAVTNSKGSKMPISFLYEKYKNSKELKESFLRRGIRELPISFSEETVLEFEEKGVKVLFILDILNISGTLGPEKERRTVKTKLDKFLPRHLRPLDIEAGIDLSLLNIVSMGFRVAVGIAAVATSNGLIPKGEAVLSIAGTGWAGGGADTAIIIQVDPNPKKCYVREIIGFPRMK